jgi:RNA polymerase sigma-70 factor (ECF subfamily)
MNVHISYKLQRTPDIDNEIQHWIAKVQKRLQVFRPELVHLKGLLEQNSAREGTTVSLNLRLPSGQMATQESAPNATSALKAAFDDLLGQIGRHKDLLRNSHRWRRRRVAEERPIPEVPFEETVAAVPLPTASAEDIRSHINANFRRLGLFVERELAFREDSGEIEPDSISPEEVVDEAVARALDEKIDKPDRMGLEAWLYRLARESMNDFKSRLRDEGSDVNVQGLRRQRNEQASDEAHLQFHQPDEQMTTESSISSGTPTPEDVAYTDEMFTLVQFALGGAASGDREAFILHALEGFSIEEIVSITDRKPEQVRQAIGRAREKLRQAFPPNNPIKNHLLQVTGTR